MYIRYFLYRLFARARASTDGIVYGFDQWPIDPCRRDFIRFDTLYKLVTKILSSAVSRILIVYV